MPTFARINWTADNKPTHDDLNDIGNSIRTWGYGLTPGSVTINANSNHLSNLGSLACSGVATASSFNSSGGGLVLANAGLSIISATGSLGASHYIKPSGAIQFAKSDTGLFGGPNSAELARIDAGGNLFAVGTLHGGGSGAVLTNTTGGSLANGKNVLQLRSTHDPSIVGSGIRLSFANPDGFEVGLIQTAVASSGNVNTSIFAFSSGVLLPVLQVLSNASVKTYGHHWNGGHFIMGSFHFWIDSSSRLWMKNAAPTSETDGVLVGSQS